MLPSAPVSTLVLRVSLTRRPGRRMSNVAKADSLDSRVSTATLMTLKLMLSKCAPWSESSLS